MTFVTIEKFSAGRSERLPDFISVNSATIDQYPPRDVDGAALRSIIRVICITVSVSQMEHVHPHLHPGATMSNAESKPSVCELTEEQLDFVIGGGTKSATKDHLPTESLSLDYSKIIFSY
ncbi:hypothetical protein [Bradyrhizobium sp. URHC0002]